EGGVPLPGGAAATAVADGVLALPLRGGVLVPREEPGPDAGPALVRTADGGAALRRRPGPRRLRADRHGARGGAWRSRALSRPGIRPTGRVFAAFGSAACAVRAGRHRPLL